MLFLSLVLCYNPAPPFPSSSVIVTYPRLFWVDFEADGWFVNVSCCYLWIRERCSGGIISKLLVDVCHFCPDNVSKKIWHNWNPSRMDTTTRQKSEWGGIFFLRLDSIWSKEGKYSNKLNLDKMSSSDIYQ